ncbi:MAG TPA: glycerol kinase GlpK [Bacilli bacterium]|nr:glycerol kinase GlpK [Bacilli bacterium]
MKKYVLAIDQGTTSSRAIIFDEKANIIASASEEIVCRYPKPGWVEQDPLEIWYSVSAVVNEALIKANLTMRRIATIGITNQRETTIVWDKKTGLPVYPAIVWQSRQSSDICDKVAEHREMIHQKTGLLLNPYFSASKIRFILDAIKGDARAKRGELLFGTVDSWLLYKLTNGEVHATDVTNASRTMLFNIFEKKWDQQLLELFNIPSKMLPEVKCCSGMFGTAKYFSVPVPITAMAGDQQAALFGHACFDSGQIKNTYGTGCFMLMNIGKQPILSKNGLLTTIAWSLDHEITYALEGSVFVAGASVQWLRDQLKMIASSPDSERSALMIDDSEGVYVVPAFVGLGTPYWDNEARGAMFGLTRNTSKYHIVRATLEAIAYQSKDVIEAMKVDTGLELPYLVVDGGATANHYLMQFQADILGHAIKIPSCLETTALGAAYLAGLATGYYFSLDQIRAIHSYQETIEPRMDVNEVDRRYHGWKRAVAATRAFKL